MKRIESFLDEYSWLFKTGIWLLLVLWAAQLNCVFIDVYKDIKNQPPRNYEMEQKVSHELYLLNERQLEEAKAKGELYGPEDYFDDYKEMEVLKYEIGIKYRYDPLLSSSTLRELQVLSMNNVGKDRKYDNDDVSIAAESFRKWIDGGGSIGDNFHAQVDKLSGKELWLIFFNWVSGFYLKGFFLVFLLFIIRMAIRKGILETILADKKKFLLAIFFWPVFLMKYPSNVIREIVVEAELRRMGNLFRKFTLEEKEFVRSVTKSTDFWSWIFNFHSENKSSFQRSFVAALAVTIFINLVPSYAQAGDFDQCELTRDGPEIVVVLSVSDCDETDNQNICDCFRGIVLFDNFLRLRANLLLVISFFCLRIFQAKEFFQKIDHVPIIGRLFAGVFTIQSK